MLAAATTITACAVPNFLVCTENGWRIFRNPKFLLFSSLLHFSILFSMCNDVRRNFLFALKDSIVVSFYANGVLVRRVNSYPSGIRGHISRHLAHSFGVNIMCSVLLKVPSLVRYCLRITLGQRRQRECAFFFFFFFSSHRLPRVLVWTFAFGMFFFCKREIVILFGLLLLQWFSVHNRHTRRRSVALWLWWWSSKKHFHNRLVRLTDKWCAWAHKNFDIRICAFDLKRGPFKSIGRKFGAFGCGHERGRSLWIMCSLKSFFSAYSILLFDLNADQRWAEENDAHQNSIRWMCGKTSFAHNKIVKERVLSKSKEIAVRWWQCKKPKCNFIIWIWVGSMRSACRVACRAIFYVKPFIPVELPSLAIAVWMLCIFRRRCHRRRFVLMFLVLAFVGDFSLFFFLLFLAAFHRHPCARWRSRARWAERRSERDANKQN